MAEHPHLMIIPALAKAFVLAGNARFTIVSKSTKVRFTYRVRLNADKTVYFVSLMTGPDNDSTYTFFGTIRPKNHVFVPDRKQRLDPNLTSIKAFRWLWAKLNEGKLHEGLEFWHEGRCGRCARTLTDPESIELGYGPECKHKMIKISTGDL